ncbi:MAG TPA: hypothetical protein VEB42_02535 [Chitinophagaceae bacterium]|nr:hypothetical protein [Chitinophagaceae bacterium]
MKYLAIILSAVMILSCKRTVCPVETDSTLVGKWKFIEYLMDPGDGSGTWQPAQANQTYVQFNADGSMSSDLGMLTGYTRYEIQPDSSLLLTTPPATNSFPLRFKITGNTLELNPPCFEKCGFKFRKQ